MTNELRTRYVVSRMKSYYNNRAGCPNAIKPILDDDYEAIYKDAFQYCLDNRFRFWLKEVFKRML